MLDLFCGRWGWSRAFAARGWTGVGVDLQRLGDPPAGFALVQADIYSQLRWDADGFWIVCPERLSPLYRLGKFDFACASSPCEEFSKWGMRCFFPNPPYPAAGIRLFNDTREKCETAGLPYIMENVRAAQLFVGPAKGHCGPFHLWGNSVPPIVPQGIIKGMTRKALGHYDYAGEAGWNTKNESANSRQNEQEAASLAATIPTELASCVADYAERILEMKAV